MIFAGGYGQFAALKTYNRDLKTLIALGGWNEGSRRFSPLVADPKRRRKFIRSAIKFLRQYNFDGLDLDWEYPAARDGGKPEDKANYAKFVAVSNVSNIAWYARRVRVHTMRLLSALQVDTHLSAYQT